METKQRLTILDSLRGLAAVGVVFFWHYQHFINTDAQIISNYPFSRLFHWFYAYGWILVDLFFVLSGFILCHNYTEKIADKLINFRQFMLYRLSRLYPLVVLTTIIVLIIQKIRIAYGLEYFVYQTNNFFHFIVNIFLLQGIIPEAKSFNAPSWAVSIEVLLYILLFIGIKFFYKKKYSFYTSMILLGFILQRFEDSIMMLSLISRGLIGFFVGCLTYELYRYITNTNSKKNIKTNILKALCLINIIFISVGAFFIPTYFHLMTNLFVIFFFPSLILLSLHSKSINLLFDKKIFHKLGALSLSVYLIHFPIQLLIATANNIYNLNINFESDYFFFFFFAITTITSYLIYNFYEQKIQSRLRLYFNK